MLAMLFVVLVVLGFVFKFAAACGAHPLAERVAWGCWMVASFIWAVGRVGS